MLDLLFYAVFISFFAFGYTLYKYGRVSFTLLETLKKMRPDIWERLGRPEKVPIKGSRHNSYAIRPLTPFLGWIWRGSFTGLPSNLAKELRSCRRFLVSGLTLFAIYIFAFLGAIVFSPEEEKNSATSSGASGSAPYVGVMDDYSYSGAGRIERINAEGNMVSYSEFDGSFIWADYAAPWCAPCGPQTQAIKSLAGKHADIVFITVMTSNSTKYDDSATIETARQWASRYSLDPSLTLAADNLWSKTIPRNVFFSPDGQTLYSHTGGLSAGAIESIINQRSDQWYSWNESGKKAGWMR